MKLKFPANNIFRYLYFVFLALNLTALFFLYQFAEKYVYDTIIVDSSILNLQAITKTDNINIEKFEKIIDNIENKDHR